MPHTPDPQRIATLMRLVEFTDSAFPVGTFSFSNGLETAAEKGLVRDAATLECYTRQIARQAAHTDCIAALHALRGAQQNHYSTLLRADREVILCKMNTESRLMTRRMGKKLAELAHHLFEDAMMSRFLTDIAAEQTPGTYPVAQAVLFAACGLSEEELFCAHQYGVMNTILSAALRCVRVSHYDTQRILFRIGEQLPAQYAEIRAMDFGDMFTFVPQADILASLHEQGTQRMFMN